MLITVEGDGHGTQPDMNTEHDGERRVNSSQFLDDDGFRNIVDG